ncbi:hypothetical protein [Prochlorothrix hollandica]|uniref:hypothetical protein n=1 Tax=Prochlorothrix hollandica TaxID=1223 RepID=UPI0033412893
MLLRQGFGCPVEAQEQPQGLGSPGSVSTLAPAIAPMDSRDARGGGVKAAAVKPL